MELLSSLEHGPSFKSGTLDTFYLQWVVHFIQHRLQPSDIDAVARDSDVALMAHTPNRMPEAPHFCSIQIYKRTER